MISKLFKKTKKEVAKSNIEKLNNNELKNVVGGTDTSDTSNAEDLALKRVRSGSTLTAA